MEKEGIRRKGEGRDEERRGVGMRRKSEGMDEEEEERRKG